MTDRIDSQVHSSTTELSDHAPLLVAEAYNLPSSYDIQVTPQYPNCHSTPHGNDILPGVTIGGGGSANQSQEQAQQQSQEQNSVQSTEVNTKVNTSANVKSSVEANVQSGNSSSEATGGKANATGGSAKIGDITNTNTAAGGTATVGDINNTSQGGKGGKGGTGGKGGSGGSAVVNETTAPSGPSAYAESAVQPTATIPNSGLAQFNFSVGVIHFGQQETTGSDSNTRGLDLHAPIGSTLFPIGLGAAWGSSHVNQKGMQRVQEVHEAGLASGLSILGEATGDQNLVREGNSAYAKVVQEEQLQKETQKPELKGK